MLAGSWFTVPCAGTVSLAELSVTSPADACGSMLSAWPVGLLT